MTILNINGLGVTLDEPLFRNLTLTVSKGDRIGLVASNGRGKSTLLRSIAGLSDATEGEITRSRGLRVGYVPQNVPKLALSHTLYDWVLAALPVEQAEYESWRVDVVLDELQIPYEFQHKLMSELSGGWQRSALLAAVWVVEPDLLLLDEPTNHLDLFRIGLLQDWLSALPHDVPIIVTSHDRAFLDAVTNRTLFLRIEQSRTFQLPYSKARAALDEADKADERRFTNDLNKAKQLRKQAAKLKNIGINSGSDLLVVKTKQLNARAAQVETAARPAYQERSAGKIQLVNAGTHSKALITLDNIPVETPDGRLLYRTARKWVSPGDRVVLLGANGAGKTQLIKMIQQGLREPDAPVKCAASVVPAYSDQNLSQLGDKETPMSVITGQFDIGDQRARSALVRAGVSISMQDKKIAELSGGQKARLAMLVLRLKQPNFYLLDEPTNHLDIEGQEALERELIAHDISCVLVSHDRSFLRGVGNRFWWINGKTLEEVDSPEAFLSGEMGPVPQSVR